MSDTTRMILTVIISVCCSIAASMAVTLWHLKEEYIEHKKFIEQTQQMVNGFITANAELNKRAVQITEMIDGVVAELKESSELK